MIRIEELHQVFDLWIDKVGAPYFTSGQKDMFLRKASIQFVNKFFKNPSLHTQEETYIDTEDLHPLIYNVPLRTNTSGEVFYTDINNNLPKNWMYMLAVYAKGDEMCGDEMFRSRWMRHNSFAIQSGNSFKKPEYNHPVHRYYSNKIKFSPSEERVVSFTVIVYPNEVSLDDPTNSGVRGTNAVDLDLPERVFDEVVYLALTQSGVNMREQDFYAMTGREAINNV